MQDERIIELYFERSENAVKETEKKYGRYCYHIAFNILHSSSDSEECVNDTYLRAWNSMPPNRPVRLSVFLGRITRHLALNRYEKAAAKKRGGGTAAAVLDELSECIPDTSSDDITQEFVITETLNKFLADLPEQSRIIFVRRYWYLSPIKEIAYEYGMGESRVKMILLRSRNELKKLLEEEGIIL